MHMQYTFVWKKGGWWLKISTLNELFNYWDKTDSKWSKTFFNLIHSKEFGKGMTHANTLEYAVGLFGEKRGLDAIHAVAEFAGELKAQQMEYLLAYKALYFNENGGYHFNINKEKDYTQICTKDSLSFPEFGKKDIRIKQFPEGTHFYAYVGNVQIKDGDTLKWNTYEEAYNRALEITEFEDDREL